MPVENQIELTGVNTKEQLEELNKVLSMEDKIQTKDTDNDFIGDDDTVYTNNTNNTNKAAEKPTVLLTGGAGFIGSHTYVELTHQFNVVIVDNLYNANVNVIDKLQQITESSVIFYEIDLLDKPSLRQIFQKHKPKAVIHFAGLKAVGESIKKPLFYYENNLVSTLNLLQTMEEHNCFQLIFSSSATVYGSNISPLSENMEVGQGITNPYGQTKFMIERHIQFEFFHHVKILFLPSLLGYFLTLLICFSFFPALSISVCSLVLTFRVQGLIRMSERNLSSMISAQIRSRFWRFRYHLNEFLDYGALSSKFDSSF